MRSLMSLGGLRESMTTIASPATRLLIRRFLQGLLHNDLLSPDADRRDSVATWTAALITVGVFSAALLTLRYLIPPFLSPGRTAVGMLDDTFLFVGWSLAVGAGVAIVQWNALPLDARDAAVLGTLPVERATIARAKLAAVGLFASGLAVALNAAPSVIYPVLIESKLGGGTIEIAQLVFAHMLSTMAAAWFGFSGVVAIRELTRALAGGALFARIGPALQSGLLVLSVIGFLLLPGGASRVARTWLDDGESWRRLVPVLWFVGLHDTLAGKAVIGVPPPELPPYIARFEQQAMPLYVSRIPVMRRLAGVAGMAFAVAALAALAAFLWNSRRLTTVQPPLRRSRLALFAGWLLRRAVARRQGVRAGFFFALQCLARSAPHRAAIGVAIAVGLAATLVNTDLRTSAASSVPLSFLGSQYALLAALVVAFGHIIRTPADVRANWVFQLAWMGDERPYVTGVKRAALVGLVLPALVALLPLNVNVLGWRLALCHTLNGLLVAAALLELLMLNTRKLPLASTFAPMENVRWVAPVGLVAFLVLTSVFVFVERAALASGRRSIAFAGTLAAVVLTVRLAGWLRRRGGPVAVDFSELPPPAQTLNLTD